MARASLTAPILTPCAQTAVICACIDIGSNTTRLLVADVSGGALREVVCERAFTRIGRELRANGAIPPAKVAEVAEVVAAQLAQARALGAAPIRVVATAAIRAATNRDDLVAAVRERAAVEVDVLDGDEEARLAFLGAANTLPQPPVGRLAVVDCGGGSTEIAIGTLSGGVEWARSVAVGSGLLADAHLIHDPPSAAELEEVRRSTAAAFGSLTPPPAEAAVAVGGSATSLFRLVGAVLEPAALAHGLGLLSRRRSEDVADAYGLDPQRVRLLPAGLIVLAECGERIGRPLRIGRGGLREGVCLELAAV